MAYFIKDENGVAVKKDGDNILASDITKAQISELDEEKMSFLAVASTEDEDRDNDIVRVAGWNLTNYKKSPIIPWSHDYWSVPIGKSLMIKKDLEKKQLIFRPQFDSDDEAAVKVFNKYKNGYLTSFSVGFRGLESSFRDPDDRWRGGQEFTKQELLEISCVGVPANPNANINVRSAGNKSLLGMGYSQVFTKIPSGLFYPIRDLEAFVSPEEKQMADGVMGLMAKDAQRNSIDVLVGFTFDSELFDSKSANEWVKENVKPVKIKYYDMLINKEDGSFSLEVKEEMEEIKTFDSCMGEETEKNKLHESPIDEKIEDKKYTVTTEVSIKDANGKVISNFNDTEEFVNLKDANNSFVTLISKDNAVPAQSVITSESIDTKLFEELLIHMKKLVAKQEENGSNVIKNDDQLETPNDDDNIFELDDGLFSPDDPNTNKKLFEIDEDILKGAITDGLSGEELEQSDFTELLKKTIKAVSGKLEE